MDKLHRNIIENIKNILLVVLVFTTILLLYFLWGSQGLESLIFNDNDENYEAIRSEEIILPDQIIVGRGNGDYTVAFLKKDELWNSYILNTFKNFSEGGNALVEEITEAQYESVMEYPAILAKFSYNIPFLDFCSQYGIKQLQGYDNINSMSEIGFSQGSPESTFIYDGNKNKYYRLLGNEELKIFEEIDKIVEEQGFVTYYKLKNFLGEGSDNKTLIPVEFPVSIPSVPYKRDIEALEKGQTEATAQAYFGGTSDFVRKVEESDGTTIYMYGYGQKVLIISPEGYIEYKEDVKGGNGEQHSMFNCLDTALAFISAHGGFETASGQKLDPYLKSVSQINDKRNSYRFTFSFRIAKNKLFYEEAMPVIIEITDGQVSYYRKELLNFDESQAAKYMGDEGISAINMLALNYEYMKGAFGRAGTIDKEELQGAVFENIANQIDNLSVGYVKTSPDDVDGGKSTEGSRGGELKPAWIVQAKGISFYFDLYEGQPLGYSQDSL